MKRKHVFFFIGGSGAEQSEITRPARKSSLLTRQERVQLM
jgi:hypothetical protein